MSRRTLRPPKSPTLDPDLPDGAALTEHLAADPVLLSAARLYLGARLRMVGLLAPGTPIWLDTDVLRQRFRAVGQGDLPRATARLEELSVLRVAARKTFEHPRREAVDVRFAPRAEWQPLPRNPRQDPQPGDRFGSTSLRHLEREVVAVSGTEVTYRRFALADAQCASVRHVVPRERWDTYVRHCQVLASAGTIQEEGSAWRGVSENPPGEVDAGNRPSPEAGAGPATGGPDAPASSGA